VIDQLLAASCGILFGEAAICSLAAIINNGSERHDRSEYANIIISAFENKIIKSKIMEEK
jgi:hypothetical protein